MAEGSRKFQVFVKPTGALCNLECAYCYYLKTGSSRSGPNINQMSENTLAEYIKQHIEATPGKTVSFTWHGGEPTLLGLDYFKKITRLQQSCAPSGMSVINNIQSNGTLIDEEWSQFFYDEGFIVGLSLDGPAEFHDAFRKTRSGNSSHALAMKGYEALCRHSVPVDILCVVNVLNVNSPLEVYRYFKQIGASYIGFLPLVEPIDGRNQPVSHRSVPSLEWGEFLCAIFDEWKNRDIGKITVQMIEEVAQKGLGKDHALCIFKKTCGDVPVVEVNGDFFPCDHYVNDSSLLGNVHDTHLKDLIESSDQRKFGSRKSSLLPRYCLECEVLDQCWGECPKNRLVATPEGEPGLNYLCSGYKRFFNHTQSFVKQIEIQAGRKANKVNEHSENSRSQGSQLKIGRNDPCPCGSGKKYKKCCLRSVSAD